MKEFYVTISIISRTDMFELPWLKLWAFRYCSILKNWRIWEDNKGFEIICYYALSKISCKCYQQLEYAVKAQLSIWPWLGPVAIMYFFHFCSGGFEQQSWTWHPPGEFLSLPGAGGSSQHCPLQGQAACLWQQEQAAGANSAHLYPQRWCPKGECCGCCWMQQISPFTHKTERFCLGC